MPSVFSTPTIHELPWLIRTDFTDQAGWEDLCRAIEIDQDQPDEDPRIEFAVVDDPVFDGLTPDGLLELEPYPTGQYFLADQRTISHPEHPVAAVDVESARSFRLIPGCVQEFAVNMLLSNLDFENYADGVGPDGIFRGFTSAPGPDATTGSLGSLTDVVNEADPDDPESFVGELIRTGFWNPASWQRLEAGMREACRTYDGAAEVPRALTAAFHSVLVRVPNLVVLPGFVPVDPAGVQARLDRIRVLSSWFFRGWTTDRPDGPVVGDLPGEYDPDASHG